MEEEAMEHLCCRAGVLRAEVNKKLVVASVNG